MRRLVLIVLLCLGLAPAWAETGMDWVEQAQQAEAAGQIEQAVAAWQKASELLTDQAAQATALFFLGRGQMQLGNYPEALTALRSSLGLFDELDRDDGRAMVESQLGYLYIELRKDAEAEASFSNALKAAQRHGDSRRIREVLEALAKFCDTRHRWPEAARYYRLLVEQERAAGDLMAAADHQITLGAIAQMQSDYTGAESLYSEALELFEQQAEPAQIEQLVDRLARLHLQSEQFEKATQEFARVVELARARQDDKKVAATLANLGYAHQRLGQAQPAAEAFRASVELFTQLGDDDNRRLVWRQLIKVLAPQEQARELERLYPSSAKLDSQQKLEAAGLCLELGQLEKAESLLVAPADEGRASFLNRAGMLWARYSRYDRARPLYDEALELARKEQDRGLQASILNNLGEFQNSTGSLDKAESTYRLAYELFEQESDLRGLAYLCNNLGQVYFDQGRYRQALQTLARAEKLCLDPDVFGKPVPLLGTVLNAIGLTHVFLGRGDDAQSYYERALAIRRALNDRRGEVVTLTNLAVLQGELQQEEKATETTLEALGLALELKDPQLVANLYNNLGSQYLAAGDLEAAEQAFTKALASFRKIGAAGSEGITLDNLAALLVARKKRPEALQYQQQAIGLLEKSGLRYPLCQAYLHLARNLWFSGQSEQALPAAQKAWDLLEELSLGLTPQDRSTFLQRARDIGGLRMNLLLQSGQAEAAFQSGEQTRAQELLAMLAGRETSLEGVPVALIERERTLRETIRQLVGSPFTAANRTELNRYKTLYREALQEIARFRPMAADTRAPQAAGPAEVCAALAPDQAMIGYYLFERTSMAVVLTSEGFKFYNLPIAPVELKRSVRQARRLLGRSETAAAAEPTLAELGQGLFAPLKEVLRGKSHLIIVPSQDLHYLPFGSLKVDGHPLVENYRLELAGSATAWLLLHRRPAQPGPVAGFALGNASIDWTGAAANLDAEIGMVRGQIFAALPGTLHELEELKTLFPASRAFKGEELTLANLEQQAAQAGLLHVATHGVLDRRYPLFSGLVATDGMLTVGDIFDWKLNNSVVVLSACQTGLGKVADGDDIVGLTRAFQYAGTRALVASLWEVDDTSTADWMGWFYQELRRGATAAEAHQAATLTTRKKYPNPFYWAPFTLYGDGTTRLSQ
ncbi:MAG: CHAT domain-containing protein [Candidatus Eremiobacteraeota bacterium]|nr:CHAT domain-containing protein [Candidatus Eremiobacteraeota bacterium]